MTMYLSKSLILVISIMVHLNTMANTIIQWNCRGLRPNFEEICLLINNHHPVALCLQETFLKENDSTSFKYHSIYNKIFTEGQKAQGGVSIIVNNNIPTQAYSLGHKFASCCSKIVPAQHSHTLFYIPSTPCTHRREQASPSHLPITLALYFNWRFQLPQHYLGL